MSNPWHPTPEFKKIPEINPRTNKPVQFLMCTVCGGVVTNRKMHNDWHSLQNN